MHAPNFGAVNHLERHLAGAPYYLLYDGLRLSKICLVPLGYLVLKKWYHRIMVERIVSGGWVASILGLLGVMFYTTPADVHPVVILITFVLMYISVLCALFFLIKIGVRIVMSKKANSVRPSNYVIYMFASVLALAPIIALAMKSVGALRGVEVVLIIVFELIACFYLWRRAT